MEPASAATGPSAPAGGGTPNDSTRKLAHTRFARAVFGIYLGTALVACALLVGALATDQSNEETIARGTLALTAEVRADYFARHLGLLATELRRLGLRSEIDLLDQNLEPEQGLLRLSHSKSTFFNVGVAILDVHGSVLWSEPQSFIEPGTRLGHEPWFQSVRTLRSVRVVPVAPEKEHDSLVFVISPIVRNSQFTGALVGAVDLAFGDTVEGVIGNRSSLPGKTVLATRDGRVVYPPKPPSYAGSPAWDLLFQDLPAEGFVVEADLDGEQQIVAGAPVRGSDLVLLSLTPAGVLFAPARRRLFLRLGLGLALTLIPNLLLLGQLRRSLRSFRTSEEQALRGERLRFLGEAANLIAHEVKNALNSIRLGLDLALSGDRTTPDLRRDRAAQALRQEVQRLSEFTSELLTFAKGVVPRPVPFDIAEFVERVTEIHRPRADELGAKLRIQRPKAEIRVHADPALVHVVIGNLITNALEAIEAAGVSSPEVVVTITEEDGAVRVAVADNGPGVPASFRPRLFEPFSTSKPSGVGIGLALSRNIARAHGGDLILLDPSTSGATFVLHLPRKRQA